MKRIQRVLFALAAVAALGWFAAEPALAQVRWATTGGLRIVRAEGRTEVVNALDLVAQTGAGTIADGTVITLTYDGDITNNFVDGDDEAIIPSDLVECAEADGVNDEFCLAVPDANITIDGSDLFIELDGTAVEDGDRLTVSGVRIDVAAAGPGDLRVTITSSGDPAGERVTYTNPTVLVARARASLKITITPSENDMLLCDPQEEGTEIGVTFKAKVTELFSSAFADEGQEEDAGIEDDAEVDINQGVEIRFRLSGVNEFLSTSIKGSRPVTSPHFLE